MPNGYDLSFLAWFRQFGWRVYRYCGQIQIWSNGDTRCPFKVTDGVIARLEASGQLERVWLSGCVFDEWWI